MNLILPKGDKGDKGEAFQYSDFTQEQLELLRGPQGDKGDKGNVGEQGPQGPKGDKGETYDDTEIKNNVELLESQIPNGQAEGENITLTDSSNLPYKKFNIGGKSIQETRSGKNQLKGFKEGETSYFYSLVQSELADDFYFKATPVADNWLKVECDRTGETTTEIKYINAFIGRDKIPNLKVSTDYTIIVEFRNVNITKISGGLSLARSSINETASNAIFSLSSHIDYSKIKNGAILKFLNPTESTFENQTVALRNFHATYTGDKFSYEMRISVVEGDYTNKDYIYEDFGASPSPEYPSEIKSVGDDGAVEIKQSGKNLANITNGNTTKIKTFNITNILQKGKTYSFNAFLDLTENTTESRGRIRIDLYVDDTVTYKGGNNIGSTEKGISKTENVTIGEDVTKVLLNIQPLDISTFNCNYSDVQVEESPIVTEYEPYKENNYVLQVSQPLRSLPNGVRDTIEEDGIHRRIRTIELKISNMDRSDDYPGWSNVPFLNEDYVNVNNATFPTNIISNIGGNKTYFGINTNGTNSILLLNKGSWGLTQSQWKEQYSDLVVQLQYEILEEIIEPYTDNQLQKATSYKNTTHIFSTDEVSPVFDITYKKDLEILHDKNYLTNEELEDKGYLTEIPDTYKTKTENDELYQSKGNYANKDDIPSKTSELENDSGFLEHKGTFYDWPEFDAYEFKEGEMFLFTLSGAFSSYMGDCIGQYSAFKTGSNYIYRYIECYNLTTQQSLTLDILYKKVTIKQMNIQDINDYFTNSGLDDVLQEIGGQLNGIEELLGGI